MISSATHNTCSHIANMTKAAIQTRKRGDLLNPSYFPAKRLHWLKMMTSATKNASSHIASMTKAAIET